MVKRTVNSNTTLESAKKRFKKFDRKKKTVAKNGTAAVGIKKSVKWTNKTRVLVFASRGINARGRHLLNDLRSMMPHSKPDSKMDHKDKLPFINDICEMKNCNKCIFFEARKREDLYMWISNVPDGPCAKFQVENIHTMLELRLTGNCLKGSRPLLSFDTTFDSTPEFKLLRELFTQVFSTPSYHPKSQPFHDNVYTFAIMDNKIWFRNYQIIEEDGSLAEIGPRFVLDVIKIFDGSFGGATLFENNKYLSPNVLRRVSKQASQHKYRDKIAAKVAVTEKKANTGVSFAVDETDDVFNTLTTSVTGNIREPIKKERKNRVIRPGPKQRGKNNRKK